MVFNKKFIWIGFFEIFLVVMAVVAFSYIYGESNYRLYENYERKESKFVGYLRAEILKFLSSGIVSAQSPGLWTCLENKNGGFCQEYYSGECNEQCNQDCFPGRRNEYSECKLGTCFDPEIGLCNDRTPKTLCESSGGIWSLNTPATCNKNCCLINPNGQGGGDQARFSTQRECNNIGQQLGTEVEWIPVENELACLVLANTQDEGACVLEFLPERNKYECRYTSRRDCLVSGGDFYNEQLCTNPELNTVCERTDETSCLPGKDEVYFVDSCGNPANIYDSTKLNSINYWSKKFADNEVCVLSNGDDSVARQRQCGNCNYLQGSICGEPRSGVDDSAIYGDYVCKDLKCIDEFGNERKHGESWCAFEGQIGVDNPNNENLQRSVDIPGSRHYKRICFDGEVRTEPCADGRQEICQENRDEDLEFSFAACRINQWQFCIDANTDEKKLAECEEHTDCKLQKFKIEDYEFDVCVPKYPAGFQTNSRNANQGNELVCGIAGGGGGENSDPFKCTKIEVKELFGGWECQFGCDCTEEVFTESINNLCMSLGDCGGNINLEGVFSDDGYILKAKGHDDAKDLSPRYIYDLRNYVGSRQGQFVDSLSRNELEVIFPNLKGKSGDELDKAWLDIIGGFAGALGSGLYLGGLADGVSLDIVLIDVQLYASALGTSVVAALIAVAVTSFLLSVTGITGGLPDWMIATIQVTSAVSGILLGLYYAGASSTAGPLGFILAGIIIVFIAGATIAGVGDTRETKVYYSCLPWQPPNGGENCEICNDYEFGCSQYKCESLGKNCRFVNVGSENELCTNAAPNDVEHPNININNTVISEGFKYVNHQTNIGSKIEINEADGCIKEYTPVKFGLILDEPGQCKFSEEHINSYDEMNEFFGGSNFYDYNHETVIAMPILSGLGVVGRDPNRRGEYNLYVRCQDFNGNSNVREYAINFCVKPADDINVPEINLFVPESPGFASLETEEFGLRFFTNEPAECKWSLTDQDYNVMQEIASCNNDISQVTLNGWACNVILPVTQQNNDYYIRCLDQPWLSDISLRNANSQSINYKIEKTTEELVIGINKPTSNQEIFSAVEPVSIDIEISTSGGIDGNAVCKYRFGNSGLFSNFFETGNKVHKQTFSSIFSGNYDLEFKCEDNAGNIAEANVEFKVEVDNEGPLITRVFNLNGNTNVVTNEESLCYYSLEGCGFSIEEGRSMSVSEQGKRHSASLDRGLTYGVKCEDTFGNVGACLMIRNGY